MKKRTNHYFLTIISFILFTLVSCGGNNPVDCRRPDRLEDVDLQAAYDYFVGISRIPRCSREEKAASYYLAGFAKAHGAEIVHQDNIHNLLVRKPGSKGRENEPPIILQAHIDMICEKDSGWVHDFQYDPIIPIIAEGGWVRASGRTTLGADNGSGVAMIMAVLASKNYSHPPIEALFTVWEEIGLLGAFLFDVSQLTADRLINLDSVREKMLIAGSTRDGGDDTAIPMLPEALAKIASLPDWHFREESPLRDTMVEVFRKVYGEEPVIARINNNKAGVEPIAFADRMPHLDMISIGPDILDIHTPDERMSLSSFYRVYNYLIKVLEAL
ncbi:MAG: M20/M25/M40 family metallo-hydrolase [Chitinispirillia bacterium]|nr:M20/M25/M40 family metallo-hydrolase [Chitinispirillia bacterium]